MNSLPRPFPSRAPAAALVAGLALAGGVFSGAQAAPSVRVTETPITIEWAGHACQPVEIAVGADVAAYSIERTGTIYSVPPGHWLVLRTIYYGSKFGHSRASYFAVTGTHGIPDTYGTVNFEPGIFLAAGTPLTAQFINNTVEGQIMAGSVLACLIETPPGRQP